MYSVDTLYNIVTFGGVIAVILAVALYIADSSGWRD
jgi:hypothetical protein